MKISNSVVQSLASDAKPHCRFSDKLACLCMCTSTVSLWLQWMLYMFRLLLQVSAFGPLSARQVLGMPGVLCSHGLSAEKV